MPVFLYSFKTEVQWRGYEQHVERFLEDRFNNGQLKSLAWIPYWRQNVFYVVCETYWDGTLEKILFSNATEQKNYERLLYQSKEAPIARRLSEKGESQKTRWEDCAALIVRGSTNKEICIYSDSFPSPIWIDTLPDEFDRNEIVDWNLHYYETYIEFSQSSAPFRALRELSSYDSELNKRGRKIAANIKSVSGKPTYYCLIDKYTPNAFLNNDKCPSCSSKWYRPSQKDAQELDKFEFACHDCLLLKDNFEADSLPPDDE